MKKLLLIFAIFTMAINASAEKYILYTSSDGEIVTPKYVNFGANIVSNTYEKGQGKILFDDEVTMIGSRAFYYCDNLQSIEIPNSVTTIGGYAFRGCSGLTSMLIGNSVTTIGQYAFESCTGLTSVVIPNYVTTIDDNAFYGCSSLTSVVIGNSVTTIGRYAFSGCTSLTSLKLGMSVTDLGESAFANCYDLTSIELPNSLTKIGSGAFQLCYGLTSVEIPNSVTEIGYAAFNACVNLESFTGKFASEDHRCLIVDGTLTSFAPAGLTSYMIPNSATKIGMYAFCQCFNLTSVNVPNSVMDIEVCAFRRCTSLTSFTGKFASEDNRCLIVNGDFNSFAPAGLTSYEIPNSVTAIGKYVFDGCSALTLVNVPNSVTEIKQSAFIDCSGLEELSFNAVNCADFSSSNAAFSNCTALTRVKFGNEVTRIPAYLLYGCKSLKSVEIGNSVTTVGDNAFSGCDSLPIENNIMYADTYLIGAVDRQQSTYTIKEGTKWIGDGAFSGCSSLTFVEIPNSVTEIGNGAFRDCSSLTSVEIPNSVTAIENFAFLNCSGMTSLTIPNSVTDVSAGAFCIKNNKGRYIPLNITEYICDNEKCVDYFYSTVKNQTLGEHVNTINHRFGAELEKLTIVNNNPPTFTVSNPFTDNQYQTLNVYVSEQALSAYQSADVWKNFWNLNTFDPAGIEKVSTDSFNKSAKAYNFGGVQVNDDFKGIIIQNGKKILKK